MLVLGNDALECQPPKLALSVTKIAGNINREWALMMLEDGQGMLDIVSITIVQGQNGKALLRTSFPQASVSLIDRENGDFAPAKIIDDET